MPAVATALAPWSGWQGRGGYVNAGSSPSSLANAMCCGKRGCESEVLGAPTKETLYGSKKRIGRRVDGGGDGGERCARPGRDDHEWAQRARKCATGATRAIGIPQPGRFPVRRSQLLLVRRRLARARLVLVRLRQPRGLRLGRRRRLPRVDNPPL